MTRRATLTATSMGAFVVVAASWGPPIAPLSALPADDKPEPRSPWAPREVPSPSPWAPQEVPNPPSSAPQEVPIPPWLVGRSLQPTYTEGAGLIYEHRCVGCHREEGLGPMSFETLDDIREWSVGTQMPMKDAVLFRLMPPWPPDPAVGVVAAPALLSQTELDLLEEWIEAGYPRGEGEFDPERTWVGGWSIGTPDVVFQLPEHTLGADVEHEVVELVIQTDFPEDRWIVAAEALPGDIVSVLSIEAGPLGSYRSMSSAQRYPEGTARRLPAGQAVDVRVRYRKRPGRERTDQSRIGLVFADEPTSIREELFVEPLAAEPFSLAAGQKDLRISASWRFPEAGRIYAVQPVLYDRGLTVEYRVVLPDGGAERLLSIPTWEAKWSFRYELPEPMDVPAGTSVEIRALFDNSLDNVRNPDPWSDVEPGPAGETLEGWITYSLGRR